MCDLPIYLHTYMYTYILIYIHIFLAESDVFSLFNNAVGTLTLKLTNEQLKKDNSLKERTKWSPKQVMDLPRICLETNFSDF